jgi:hypothetical protein
MHRSLTTPSKQYSHAVSFRILYKVMCNRNGSNLVSGINNATCSAHIYCEGINDCWISRRRYLPGLLYLLNDTSHVIASGVDGANSIFAALPGQLPAIVRVFSLLSFPPFLPFSSSLFPSSLPEPRKNLLQRRGLLRVASTSPSILDVVYV